MITYILTGLMRDESSAREISSLIEKMNPTPIGTGFFELDERNSTWEIEAYFTERPNTGQLVLLQGMFKVELHISAMKKVDWVTKVQKNLTPISIGVIYIHSTHHRDKLSINKKNIEIQAAMAFGTGHHATTRSCINLILYLLRKKGNFRRAADIGCGTGILSMVAAKSSGAIITALDNDLTAVETTRTNFAKNKLSSRNIVLRSTGLRNSFVSERGKFDLIFANILFQPLKNLVKSVCRYLKPGGTIILSGISQQQAITIETIYYNHNFRRVKVLKEGPWTSLVLRYWGKYKT